MNYCNFSKVFQARTSKDKNVLEWLQSDKTVECPSKPRYIHNLSDQQRFSNYISLVSKFPKLHMPYSTFRLNVHRVQDLLTKPSYYCSNNKQREREIFSNHFSYKTWLTLPEKEQKALTLLKCETCTNLHKDFSELHVSFIKNQKQIYEACENLTEHVISKFQKTTSPKSSQRQGINIMKDVVDILQPIVENKIGTTFRTKLSQNITCSSSVVSPGEQKKCVEMSIKKSKKNIEQVMSNENIDVLHFLGSGKSYNQIDRDRFNSTFVSKEDACKHSQYKTDKEKTGKIKPKTHHGKFENYEFKKEEFISEIQSYPSNKPINWSRLAKKYDVKCQGKQPMNGGQVLMNYAKTQGVNVNTFNPAKRVSGRDYLRRVRRSQIKIGKSRISIPSSRSAKKIKSIIKMKLKTQEINIGEKIAPKLSKINKIDTNGKLTTTETLVSGRKIPLTTIVQEEIERFRAAGILQSQNRPAYTSAPKENDSSDEENSFYLKLWHDHSDILNSSYVNFMVSFLYNTNNFLTDKEYKEKFPENLPMDVQTFVERPKLYIFGKSGMYIFKHSLIGHKAN